MSVLPADSLFAQQWHLHNTAVGQFDLDVVSVWEEYTGKGARVMVMDDGFDYRHPDLNENYDRKRDRDYGEGDGDASPHYNYDNHGTAVMGLIGAALNGTGAVGVAYDATLIGARIDYGVSSNVWTRNFLRGLDDAIRHDVGVLNMSFGGAGDFDSYAGARNARKEKVGIEEALREGRDGLGLVMVKSAGNSRMEGIDGNHNQADGNSGHILVAAINRDGFVSEYSTYGAATLISAFGSPLFGEIVTTDRRAGQGYDFGDFTYSFNGTSAAAPMVSGIVALMLQANSSLGWRDVQTILANSARHVGSSVDGVSLAGSEVHPWHWNAAAHWNGGGMHFSQDYGYGLVSAHDAVRLAESWRDQSTSADQKTAQIDLLNQTVTLPDGNSIGNTYTRQLNTDLDIERVTVTMKFSADFTPDLDVYLTGPDGREQKLIHDQGYNFGYPYSGTYTLHSQAFRGASSEGQWSVRLADDSFFNSIVVKDLVVKVFGSAASPNDTYIYTDEFSDFLGSHSPNLFDTNGGADLLNAAAVTTAIAINLGNGTALVDGVAMTLSGIDDIFGGDGDDTLTGDGGANVIAGGRGADSLEGGSGEDDFLYRTARDSQSGGSFDLIVSFEVGDDIDLRRIDAMKGSAKNDKFNFIDEADFAGKAGQLRFERHDLAGTSNDITVVEADVNGDGVADLRVEISGLHLLVKADFFL